MASSNRKPLSSSSLKPAAELARASGVRFPNESAEYRRAREALLVEEIELRRHIERVAEQRRALPPGGEVKKNYAFEGETGPTSFADLFGDKDTLVVYNYMFGPQRERPCPMCTSLLSAWDGEVPDIQQRVALGIDGPNDIAHRGYRLARNVSDRQQRAFDVRALVSQLAMGDLAQNSDSRQVRAYVVV